MTSAVKTNAKKKVPQAAAEKPKGGGLGLDGLGDLSSLLDEPQAANAGTGGPRELPLDLIDEDPHQPRSDCSRAPCL